MTFIKQWKSLFEKINKDYKKYIQERLQESKDYQKNSLNKLLTAYEAIRAQREAREAIQNATKKVVQEVKKVVKR